MGSVFDELRARFVKSYPFVDESDTDPRILVHRDFLRTLPGVVDIGELVVEAGHSLSEKAHF